MDLYSRAKYWYERRDDKSTKYYYLHACREGNVMAMVAFAKFYEEKNSIHNAIKYHNMALEYGHTKSLLELGRIYGKTKGYYEQAKICYKIAIEEEIDNAIESLEKYYTERIKRKFPFEKSWSMYINKFNESKYIQYNVDVNRRVFVQMYKTLIELDESTEKALKKLNWLRNCDSVKEYINDKNKKIKSYIKSLNHDLAHIEGIHNIILNYSI